MTLTYLQRRERLYQPLRESGTFTWDWMYGEEYALASLHLISPSFRQELSLATTHLARIFAKMVPVLQRANDGLLRELGIPEEALAAVRTMVSVEIPTVVGRFDFAHTPEGLKMLEFNSDTPTGIVEAFFVNDCVCRFFDEENPNAGLSAQIGPAFQKIIGSYRNVGFETGHIWFSSLDWHEEDKGTTLYLMEQSGLGARFAPLEQLRVQGDRLYIQKEDGLEPVDVLYRLHALEKLAEERDEDGYPTGAHVLELIAGKRLAIINPPSAFLMQTKALQALIWSLYEAGEFFDGDEREIIGRYMLPTYFENRFLGTADYVTKPIFGREGGGVTLYDAEGNPLDRDREELYWEQPMIYQQRAELPLVTVETAKGEYTGRLLWGSFLIGGDASAVIARVGGPITNNLSYYLPIGIQNG
jgi:glutathionylspermidine synthase